MHFDRPRLLGTLLAIGLLATTASSGVQAQPPEGRPGFGPPSPERLLEHMDKNKDGKLSEDEIRSGMPERPAR